MITLRAFRPDDRDAMKQLTVESFAGRCLPVRSVIALPQLSSVTGSAWSIPRSELFATATLSRTTGTLVVISAGATGPIARTKLLATTVFTGARWSNEIAGPKLFATATRAGSVHAITTGEVTGTGSTARKWCWMIVQEFAGRTAG